MNWQVQLITIYLYVCKPYQESLWVYGSRHSHPVYRGKSHYLVFVRHSDKPVKSSKFTPRQTVTDEAGIFDILPVYSLSGLLT